MTIPFGDEGLPATDAGTIQQQLNAIWNRYGITWTVNVEPAFYNKSAADADSKSRVSLIDGIINEMGTGKIEAGDIFLSEYSQQQLDINRAYRDYAVAKTQYDKGSVYLFLLPTGTAPDEKKLGDMPLGKQWGYLFGTADPRTLAHELGHGKTKLDHTFYDGTIAQGKTTNLMDYCSLGEAAHDSLIRCQWEYIHDPAVFDPKQDDDDAALRQKGTCVGYVISESNGQAINTIYPYSTINPIIIFEKGREILYLNKFGNKNQYSKIKYKNESIEYGIMNKFIKAIYKLDVKEKYMLLSDLESVILPYSSTKPQAQPQTNNKKGDYIMIDKTCGDYYRIERIEDTNEGYWILKSTLKRVDKEGKDNFDDLEKVTLGTGSVDPAELAKIISNRNSINDRTKADVYGSDILMKTSTGYQYIGKDVATPNIEGNSFIKGVKEKLWQELLKEGGSDAINAYDKQPFTWGKGFAIGGDLNTLLENLLSNSNYKQIFLNVGIILVDKQLWVVDDNGNWLKDVPNPKNSKDYSGYAASNYIRNNTKMLSFLMEFADKSDYKQAFVDAQYNLLKNDKMDIPSYVIASETSTSYQPSWNDEVTVFLFHLSHWLPSGNWTDSRFTTSYENTKGDFAKVLYTFTLNAGKGGANNGTYIDRIYKWDNQYNMLRKFAEWGIPTGGAQTVLENTWGNNLIELEFAKDKSNIIRIVKTTETTDPITKEISIKKDYITNTDCVLIKKEDTKYYIITEDGKAITTATFEAP